MDISRADLQWAADTGLITNEQLDPLWHGLKQRRADGASVRVSPSTGRVTVNALKPVAAAFDLVHVAWYAGTLLIMGALGWFATLGIEAWGGPGIVAIAGFYGLMFGLVGTRLWHSADLKILGGLLVAAAVSMTPAAVYGFERTVGLWPDVDPGAYQGFFHWVKGGWFAIEVTTMVVGAIAWRLVPFSFVALPIALTAWFMSMDAAPLLIDSPDRADRGLVSVVVGLLILGAAFGLRRRQRADLNYWLEVFGVIAFQGGLLSVSSDSLGTKFVFMAIQLGLLSLGALWQRRAFSLAAAVGVVAVCGWALVRSWEDRVMLSVGLGLMLQVFGLLRVRAWPTTGTFALVVGSGVLAIGSFTALTREDLEGALVLYALWHIVVVTLGVLVRSRLLTAVGGLSIAAWLVHLAHRVFEDSMVFPFVIVSLGIVVIVAGVGLHRRRDFINDAVDRLVPEALRRLRPDAPPGRDD
jgi:hypothetical protein